MGHSAPPATPADITSTGEARVTRFLALVCGETIKLLVATLSLLIAIAGWHYLFYSRSAIGLASLEMPSANRRRIRLRRASGCVMMGLAVCFFAGFFTIDFRQQPHAYVAVWLTVFVLLGVILVLALIDLRLTTNLRQDHKGRK